MDIIDLYINMDYIEDNEDEKIYKEYEKNLNNPKYQIMKIRKNIFKKPNAVKKDFIKLYNLNKDKTNYVNDKNNFKININVDNSTKNTNYYMGIKNDTFKLQEIYMKKIERLNEIFKYEGMFKLGIAARNRYYMNNIEKQLEILINGGWIKTYDQNENIFRHKKINPGFNFPTYIKTNSKTPPNLNNEKIHYTKINEYIYECREILNHSMYNVVHYKYAYGELIPLYSIDVQNSIKDRIAILSNLIELNKLYKIY
jgi:hypothetical protein